MASTTTTDDGRTVTVSPLGVGGFAGGNNGIITGSTSSVSAPPPTPGHTVGGFAGTNEGTLNGNTFDVLRSGQRNGVGDGSTAGLAGFIDPVFPAAAAAVNAAQSIALTTSTGVPPSGNVSAAGTQAAGGSPVSAAVSANIAAVETSIQSDNQRRVQRRPRVATTAAPQPRRRPALGGSIRELQITPVQPTR